MVYTYPTIRHPRLLDNQLDQRTCIRYRVPKLLCNYFIKMYAIFLFNNKKIFLVLTIFTNKIDELRNKCIILCKINNYFQNTYTIYIKNIIFF